MQEEQVFKSKQDLDWENKTRTLIVSSRGLNKHQRNLMLGIFALLPHAKKEVKLEKHGVYQQIKQLAQLHKTRYFLYFEVKKKVNFCLWIGRFPEGPSVRLKLDNVVLNTDVKFQGNAVKGARHILSFDHTMDSDPKTRVVKELLIGAFNVPNLHPKSKAVVDHTLSFINEGKNKINFRNYQIFRQAVNKEEDRVDLYEIGPRCILEIDCILDGVLSGQVLYRAPVTKAVLKKSKADPRKKERELKVGEKNMLGEDLD